MAKYTAFISFAEPDRQIAEALHGVFESIGHRTFFGPKTISGQADTRFCRQIVEGIRESACFIEVFSRHSVRRPWVMYESGIADCLGLKHFLAGASGVRAEDSYFKPGEKIFVHWLYDEGNLADLIVNACRCQDPSTNDAPIREALKHSLGVQRISRLARTRWVFVAGNVPEDCSTPSPHLKQFVLNVTISLLENGFSISSCPQVDLVGKAVAETATEWLANKGEPAERFRIGGLYPIDRETRKSILSTAAKGRWLQSLMTFRKSYLVDQEWLVVVGGNIGTEEEWKAAKDLGIRLFPIPCFGGTSKKIWDESPEIRKQPCANCDNRNSPCERGCIRDITKTILQPA